jgi:two-component system, OmpR family, KDP operon response regulator KdpE
MGARVLVVDDEGSLRSSVSRGLLGQGFVVETAVDGQEAVDKVVDWRPDVVLMDLAMPRMTGLTAIRQIRTWSDVPIIVLSVMGEEDEKIRALDAGADDYLTKPFSLDELLARLRVARRHADRNAPTVPIHSIGRHDIDIAHHTVTCTDTGATVHLTRTEWGIIDVLLRNAGKLVSIKQLLAEVWGNGYDDDKGLLRFHMTRLRSKLESEPSRPEHLLTESGMGYRFQP